MSRPSASQRGYGPKWQQARKDFLAAHPHCVMCAELGMQTPATVVDHIVPHKGDLKLFWRRSNWRSLCAPHHNGPKQSFERTGQQRGCDEQGNPIDPNHHWRR